MDTSRKINQNAGKGARYNPDAVSQNFGQPNMAAPGAGISMYAKIGTQPHSHRDASHASPGTDHSGSKPMISAPGHSTENFSAHPAGVSGPSASVAGEAMIPPPGDLVAGRRGSPTKGTAPDRYRGK